jgi:hypothetical protein
MWRHRLICSLHCYHLISASVTRLTWTARSPVESVNTSIRPRQALLGEIGMQARHCISRDSGGESSLRRALQPYELHYHEERNHQGNGNTSYFLRRLHRWVEFRDQFNVRSDWEGCSSITTARLDDHSIRQGRMLGRRTKARSTGHCSRNRSRIDPSSSPQALQILNSEETSSRGNVAVFGLYGSS